MSAADAATATGDDRDLVVEQPGHVVPPDQTSAANRCSSRRRTSIGRPGKCTMFGCGDGSSGMLFHLRSRKPDSRAPPRRHDRAHPEDVGGTRARGSPPRCPTNDRARTASAPTRDRGTARIVRRRAARRTPVLGIRPAPVRCSTRCTNRFGARSSAMSGAPSSTSASQSTHTTRSRLGHERVQQHDLVPRRRPARGQPLVQDDELVAVAVGVTLERGTGDVEQLEWRPNAVVQSVRPLTRPPVVRGRAAVPIRDGVFDPLARVRDR